MLLSLILRNIRARRSRSLLTALSIGVNIAVIIAIFTLANNLKEQQGGFAQITQADLVAVQRGLSGPTGGSIPEERIGDIAGLEGVKRATGFLLVGVSLPQTPSFNLCGIIPEDKDLYFSESHIIDGSCIQDSGEIALGKIARDNLNLQTGEVLQLETGEELRVVGIYQTGNVYLDSGGVITLDEAQTIAGREGKVTLIPISLLPGADKEQVIEEIESQWSYLMVMPSAYLFEASAYAKAINAFAWGLSLVAVTMGCIGVASTMSMSVSERTREIGILKAIGWSRFRVLRMILGESLLLSVAGFGIGSLLGVGAVWIITSLPIAKGLIILSFTGDAFLIGLAAALLLGLLGGAFPAYRAFHLPPAEALSRE
jgi:putative ABC transport system permease protein